MFIDVLLIIVAYLLGSVSSAIIICRLLRLPDPRTQGSGNPGATNVLRVGGKQAAILTLVADVLKGVIAVLLARWLSDSDWTLALSAFAAFVGHLYPIFFKFRGGKGVATGFGALIALSWQVGLAGLATWLLMAGLFRYSSFAALTTALLAPAYLFWFTGKPEFIVTCFVMSSLSIWRHRSNIRNLLNGSENKIGAKRAE